MANVATSLDGGTTKKSAWSWIDNAINNVSTVLKSVDNTLKTSKGVVSFMKELGDNVTSSSSSSTASSSSGIVPVVALLGGAIGIASMII